LGTLPSSERESYNAVEGHGISRAEKEANSLGALAPARTRVIPTNSSHHQSAEIIGDGLRIVARCPEDGIIEGLEGTARDHFVLAVQWHPERSFDEDKRSQAIFSALVEAAREKHRELTGEFETA
jgi:gamma-glutamyl-gamma-aminobutyrate hydrolase PuuD